MTTRISQLDDISTVQGNVLVPLVSNITGNLTTVKGSVDTLKAFIVAATEANIVTANIGMKGYVDSVTTAWTANAGQQLSDLGNLYANASSQQSTLNSLLANAGSQSDLIIGINANVAAANIGIIGFIGLGNTIQSNQISAANLGMKGYVDSVASQSIYGNGNVTSYTVSMGFTNYSNVNVSALITTNGLTNYSNVNTKAYAESMGYQNYGNVNVAAYVTTANSAVIGYVNNQVSTANTAMKGYVDSVASLSIYGNGNVTSYTVSMGFTNYSNVNTKAYSESMGYQNYGNVNVSALITTNGLTNYSNINLASYLGGAVTIGGNLIVNGNLFINGNLTTINANNLSINDSMIYLADDNPADLLDIGFVSAFTDAVRYQHTGFVRDATDGTWKLFANVVAEPTTTIDFTNATYGNITVGNIAGSVNGYSIGYRDVPQITVANLTLIASDAGKHYYGANTNPTTITIPLNSSVAFGNGTAISIVNQGTGNITISNVAGVQLYLAGNTTGGSRTITSYGMATLIKVQVNTWFINGTGVV
jgi:hypothetical protein